MQLFHSLEVITMFGAMPAALTSDTFIQQVVMLLLTAIVTGTLVPIIVTYINSRSASRQREAETLRTRQYEQSQKAIEAMRIKQEAIFKAQSRLLDDVAEVVLAYETLALDVSWFGTKKARRNEMQKKRF